MNYRLFTLVILFDLIGHNLKAQNRLEIGIAGGYNKNYLHSSTGYRAFTTYEAESGFEIGLPILYHINDWFAMQIEPAYIQKNYQIKRTGFFEGIYQKNINNYIQLPIIAQFSFGGKQLRGFLNMGGYAGYWTSGRVKGSAPNVFDNRPEIADNEEIDHFLQVYQRYTYNEQYNFDSRRDRRIELGLLAGVGIQYLLQEKYRFFVEGRYYYGLTDLQKKYMTNQTPRYHDNYGIRIGCLFNLKNIFQNERSK